MVGVLKNKEDVLTREVVEGVTGKYIHTVTNLHEVINPETNEKEKVNVWFAGRVAGFEEAVINYDFENDCYLDEPKVVYHILLTDGTGYVLSEEELVIHEITEDEFIEMVASYQTEKYVKESILLPGKDF